MPRALFDSRMLSRLAEHFPSLCTIQTPPTERDAYGQIVKTVDAGWTTLAGHADLPCSIAPLSANERSRLSGEVSAATDRIALRAYYPTITSKMRAAVGSEYWGILGVQSDSQHTYTRLLVEQVKT